MVENTVRKTSPFDTLFTMVPRPMLFWLLGKGRSGPPTQSRNVMMDTSFGTCPIRAEQSGIDASI